MPRIPVLIPCLLSIATIASAQRTLTPDEISELLRHPNGLAAAASLVGNFEVHQQIHQYLEGSLSGIVASSDLIITGKILSRHSRVTHNGDDIDTDYVVQTQNILRGQPSGAVSFTLHGGFIPFPNGTSAQISTIEWRQMQIGQRYALLLTHEGDGRNYPALGLQSLFRVSTGDGKVDAFATHETTRHIVSREVTGMPVSAFLLKLEALASAKPAH